VVLLNILFYGEPLWYYSLFHYRVPAVLLTVFFMLNQCDVTLRQYGGRMVEITISFIVNQCDITSFNAVDKW